MKRNLPLFLFPPNNPHKKYKNRGKYERLVFVFPAVGGKPESQFELFVFRKSFIVAVHL